MNLGWLLWTARSAAQVVFVTRSVALLLGSCAWRVMAWGSRRGAPHGIQATCLCSTRRDQPTCRCPVSRLESAVVQSTRPCKIHPTRTESGRSLVLLCTYIISYKFTARLITVVLLVKFCKHVFLQGLETVGNSYFITEDNIGMLKLAKEANTILARCFCMQNIYSQLKQIPR
jgi:hypothetical protein